MTRSASAVFGTSPFQENDDTVKAPLGEWSHAIWSLQLTGLAIMPIDPEYARDLFEMATKMTTVVWREAHHGRTKNLRAPALGAVIAMSTCDEAAQQIIGHNAGHGGFDAATLASKLRSSAEHLRNMEA